ncbi:MAG: hypothetical protein RI556_02265 [Hydrogenovibrio sp.]|uniref:hypothetical protein n=1 Tax=Hydrogenovibrio sp. TaxID=2065821 RepID=UPI00286FFAFF|nr:hypothetical protein [Hydrogenovibrio sp.]MDR9497974.1 hypothetical protein [Hydrogenovibrio sp.]
MPRESFKAVNEICLVDIRNKYFKYVDRDTGEVTDRKIEDVHSEISSIILSTQVPKEIQSSFNTARKLALYSWYCYAFHQTAEMKAFSSLEEALKLKFGSTNKGLRDLIKKALNHCDIRDRGFQHIAPPEDPESIEYSLKLVDLIPSMRNRLAHGSQTLHNQSGLTLSICADFINQLFTYEKDN